MANQFASDVQKKSLKLFTFNKQFEIHINNSGLIFFDDLDLEFGNFTMIFSEEQLIELRNFLNEHIKDNQQ